MKLSIKSVNITEYRDMQNLELARRVKYTILLQLQFNDKGLFDKLFKITNARTIIAQFYSVYERMSTNKDELLDRVELALRGCDEP